MEFKRSTFCASGACVEVAIGESSVTIRDSKFADGPLLEFTHDEWNAFLDATLAIDFSSHGGRMQETS